jgi:signal transduction histidine kinase
MGVLHDVKYYKVMDAELTITEQLKQKIDEYNRAAWECRVSNSGKAQEQSREAIAWSREINYERGLAQGLLIEGFCFIRRSDWDNAEACLEEAQVLYESMNDDIWLSVVNEYFGIVQRNRGNCTTALGFIFKALELSLKTGFEESEVTVLYQIGVTYRQIANYDKALEYLFMSLSRSRSTGFVLMEAYCLNVIGSIFFETADYHRALDYYQQSLSIREKSGDKWGVAGSLDSIGLTYLKLQDAKKAIEFCNGSLDITKSTGDKKGEANALFHLAEAYAELGQIKLATSHCNESLAIRKSANDRRGEAEIRLFIARLNKSTFVFFPNDELPEFLESTIEIAEKISAPDLASKARYFLYSFYKEKNLAADALHQLELHIAYEKQLHKDVINDKVIQLEISHKEAEARKEAGKLATKNNELAALNQELQNQKETVERALQDLKSAQAQLIQSEKMASLGELTAGIAHEIQNPLNFVNNFSEVSNELISEMVEEVDKGNTKEVKEIAKDIQQNLEKILHHGKRADVIVKGMLQHSRSSTGQKEPTDINALCDEYLRLAYHGLRAKDNSFNASYKTDFDPNIGNIHIVPQDIGRVLLNLINNAFYAVDERKRQQQGGYEPTVTVSTKKMADKVEIKVSDNGNGISQQVLDKIFQPFFTTKPTGQGTGLGLSLSYDIIKAHAGELRVETTIGEGSIFIIHIPYA